MPDSVSDPYKIADTHLAESELLQASITSRVSLIIAHLRELILAKNDIINIRLDAMDKAVELMSRYPTAIDIAVSNLQRLHEEKFKSIEEKFHLNDRALLAALSSADGSVKQQNDSNAASILKSENIFTNQIKQLSDQLILMTKTSDDKIASNQKNLDDKISILGNRITIIESHGKGVFDSFGYIVMASVIGGVLVGIIDFFIRFKGS